MEVRVPKLEMVLLLRRVRNHKPHLRQELPSNQRECQDHRKVEVLQHHHHRHSALERERHLDSGPSEPERVEKLDPECGLDEEEGTFECGG